MISLIFYLRHSKLSLQEKDLKGFVGLEMIENLLKVVNIQAYLDVKYIGSMDSWQAISKARK